MRFGADEVAQPSAMKKNKPATMSEALTHSTLLDKFAERVTMVCTFDAASAGRDDCKRKL